MPRPPNIVFIVADDLGWADLGCYGGRSACSPALDQLARDGVRFTDGYANSALCSPSRFALITGRYQYRLRGAAEEPLTGRTRGRADIGLPPSHPTLPSLLRAAGYRTGLFGKWHLGFPPNFGPLKSGYEEFFGPLSGGVDYFSHCDPAGAHDLFEDDSEVWRTGYLTDLITERAVDFVNRSASAHAPFFASVHYTAPHWPWETRDDQDLASELHGRIEHTDGGSVTVYQTMIRHMDEGIGRILAALAGAGMTQDTLVVFTSDNGGERYSDVWPLVGSKMDLLEGGIRVPAIARWPARVRPSQVSPQVAISMDWAPTMLAAAGVAAAAGYPLDGCDLLPVITGAGAPFERTLFWRMKFRGQRACRHGNWKYLALDGQEYLFDLAVDVRERANQARRHPRKFARMQELYREWESAMPPIPADALVSHAYPAGALATPFH